MGCLKKRCTSEMLQLHVLVELIILSCGHFIITVMIHIVIIMEKKHHPPPSFQPCKLFISCWKLKLKIR